MKRNITWGALVIIPLVVITYVYIGVSIDPDFAPPFAEGDSIWSSSWWAIVGVACTIPWLIFVLHAARNKRLSSSKRALWILGMCFIHFYLIPFYWWHYAERNDA